MDAGVDIVLGRGAIVALSIVVSFVITQFGISRYVLQATPR